MKALVKTVDEDMQIRDVDMPRLQNGEVMLKVHSVGICGTDLKIYMNQFPCNAPVILGHEFSGTIIQCAPDVKEFHVGQRVIAEQHFDACGICEFCLTGKRQWCKSKRSPGYMCDGAFAEYIAVSKTLIHVIPENITMEQATVIEPMGIAAFAVYDSIKVQPEETVVILGSGPIALLAVQIVRAAGAGKIVVTGLDIDEQKRFALARKYGADETVNVQRMDIKECINEWTDGVGVDVVMDFSGAPQAILDGLDLLKKGGRFCAVGMPHEDITLPWKDLVLSAKRIIFSYSSNFVSWKRCLSLIERGAVSIDEYTKCMLPMEKWKEAFELALKGEYLKVILTP